MTNLSALNPVTYATIGNGSSYSYTVSFSAAATGSVKVADIDIDGNVIQAKVKSTDLQGYNLYVPGWCSTQQIGNNVYIN